MLHKVNEIDISGAVSYVHSLQNEDGSFSGDQWGEIDTRFSFCALAILHLLVSCKFSIYCIMLSQFIKTIISNITSHVSFFDFFFLLDVDYKLCIMDSIFFSLFF